MHLSAGLSKIQKEIFSKYIEIFNNKLRFSPLVYI